MNNGQVFVLCASLLFLIIFPRQFFMSLMMDSRKWNSTLYIGIYIYVYICIKYTWEVIAEPSLFFTFKSFISSLQNHPSFWDGRFVCPTSPVFQDCPYYMCQVLPCSLWAPPRSLGSSFSTLGCSLLLMYCLFDMHFGDFSMLEGSIAGYRSS